MLLVVDIGNTNIAAGLYEGERLVDSWRLSSRRDTTADESVVILRSLLGDAAGRVRGGIVGSVVPQLTRQILDAVQRVAGIAALEVAPGIRTGLKIRTDIPQEVGADRIVNAVAAHHRHGGPAVVVDLGTATTLDVVTADCDYLGGIICPGPQLGAEALALRTARLPRVDLTLPPRVIGRNTMDSVRSGLMYGHAAMVDGLVERIEKELGQPAKVILTGGLAGTIAPQLRHAHAIEPDLTLEGLRLIYTRNAPR
ncbi:MAG: type III pantothenate kinase [Acidobacteria bacterium]|nr:type III pantothenate kinase [Acidobacteriota bacterium]